MNFFHDKLVAIPADEGGQIAFGDAGGWSGTLGALIPQNANAMMVLNRFLASGYTFSKPSSGTPITNFDWQNSQKPIWIYGRANLDQFQTHRTEVWIQFFKYNP